VQPVHSWKDSQMSGRRGAERNASARSFAELPGRASSEARSAHCLRKARRLPRGPDSLGTWASIMLDDPISAEGMTAVYAFI
jgi:hypothetical protein